MNATPNGRAALAAAALCLGAGWAGPAAAEQRYWVTELGVVDAQPYRLNSAGDVAGSGFVYSKGSAVGLPGSVMDLNERGQVLGQDSARVWLYDRGAFTDLAGLVFASDLNDLGEVAGAILDPAGTNYEHSAALWRNGKVVDLGAALKPFGSTYSDGRAVNNKGAVVGEFSGVGPRRTFLWSGGVVTVLPFDELISSEDGAHGPISDAGVVAGFYTGSAGERRLGTWQNGVLTDLGAGLSGGPSFLDARGMNARGDVYGNAESGGFLQHGYVYTAADRKLQDIGSLGGYTCVHGVNARGDVVGHSRLPGEASLVDWVAAGPQVIWTGGKLHDLNGLLPPGSGYVLSDWRIVVNDNGQIATGAWAADGLQRPVLLTPLPVTTATLTGTKRADGWYTSNVTVKLAATDAVTGVASVRYSVDGGATTTVAGAAASVSLTAAGTHLVTYSAVDRKGHAEAAKTLFVSIDKGTLVVTTVAAARATTGAAYSQQLAAKGGTAPYAFKLAAGALPAGLALSASGLVSGTPIANGSYTFKVQVTDAKKVTSASYVTLEVQDRLSIALPPELPATGTGPLALTAAGGKPPYRWSVAPATPLPEGMALDFQTLFGGTGLAKPSQPVAFTVTDAEGRSTSASVTFTFNPPLVTAFNGGATTVVAGQPISLSYTVTGGDGSWNWSGSGLDLPPGLVWSGLGNDVTIWGSIGQPGTYTVGFTAADNSGNFAAPVVVTLTIL